MIPSYIIVHCSATRDSESRSWDAIKRWHVENNSWTDIGYHYGIEEYQGQIVLLRGREPWMMGAHCSAATRNYDSLGVCVVGEFDSMPMPTAKYKALLRLLRMLCIMFQIDPDCVKGHREYEPSKTCPGLMVDLIQLREDINARLLHSDAHGIYASFSNL